MTLLAKPRQLAAPTILGIISKTRSNQKIRHFSFHKNLTVYYKKVASGFSRMTDRSCRHFNSLIGEFEAESSDLDIASLNNHFLALESAPSSAKFSLFIRDPRDLVVSGYFYHKRGAEPWCRIKDPDLKDLLIVNGRISSLINPGESFQDCLNRLPLNEGLLAEIQFRKGHLEVMRKWLNSPPEFIEKYENIIGNERDVFSRLGRYYGLNRLERSIFERIAAANSANRSKGGHIRDPRSGQWREVFPRDVARIFSDEYGDILEAANYELE